MKLTWIGHSCFKVEKDGYAVVIDPYRDGSVPGYAPVRETADLVLCSHEHGDHNARENVVLRESGAVPFRIETIETFHDDEKGTKRGRNTIHIIDDGETRIAHLGDLGCELEEEQLKKLQGLDAVLIPVGGFFTIGAKQAADLLKKLDTRIAIPMHFRQGDQIGYDVIGTVDAFTEQMADYVILETHTIDLPSSFSTRVLVLQAQNACFTFPE